MTPTVEMVKVVDLKVDHSYQRPVDDRRIALIAADYSPSLAGVIDVSRRVDGLYCFDGQHRFRGAERAGVDELPANIHVGLTVADEARLFVAKNTSTVKPTTFAVFRARLEAGEPIAVQVAGILRAAGVSISSSGTAVRATKAVASVERVFKLTGPDGLAATLRVLSAAYGDDRYAFDAVPVTAVGSFIAVYRGHPNYSEARVSQKLGEKPARWIGQRRQAMLTGSSFRLSLNSAIDGAGVAVVLEAYNRGLRLNHLPPVGQAEYGKAAKGQLVWFGERLG